jgi:tetratricopeptide (TPR) repeat protein
MVGTLSASEEAQLHQTIEMFEVITQSQPQDYQSLEILKEAYQKLARDSDVINTSKRIAQAYVMMGQLSSAILEYESVLQRCPEDAEVAAALSEIVNKANTLNAQAVYQDAQVQGGGRQGALRGHRRRPSNDVQDFRRVEVDRPGRFRFVLGEAGPLHAAGKDR